MAYCCHIWCVFSTGSDAKPAVVRKVRLTGGLYMQQVLLGQRKRTKQQQHLRHWLHFNAKSYK